MVEIRETTPYDAFCKTFVADDVVFTYKWEIEDYKQVAKKYPMNVCLKSDIFQIPIRDGDIPFQIYLYPNGCDKKDNIPRLENVSAELHFTHERSLCLRIQFAAIDRDGYEHWKTKSEMIKARENVSFGMLNQNFLMEEGSRFLSESGNLTIIFEITIIQDDASNRSIVASNGTLEDSSTHADDMKNMLQNAAEYLSDISIECSDGNIPCHSNILASKSEVFKAMFSHDMLEARSRKIEMKDEEGALLSKEMVLTILLFIYTGKIDTEKISLALLKLADKYKLQHLKNQCVKHLCNNIDVHNCVDTIVLADRILNTGTLKMAAKDFILDNLTPDLQAEIKNKCGIDLVLDLLVERSASPPAKRQRTKSEN